MTDAAPYDYAVIGGGFFGCALALFLRSAVPRVILIERGDRLLDRASRVNQARLHTGFHYPRSMLTALKSSMLCGRFATDFPDAVVSDFRMLYAIARHRSLVPANRFRRMFENMKVPITEASPSETALFDDRMIEAVFRCPEYAFDYSVLRDGLGARLDTHGVAVRLGTEIAAIESPAAGGPAVLHPDRGETIRARHVFNVTYAGTNRLLQASGLPRAALKHEAAEICLVEPPEELSGYGVTVMDGPFFSIMPYPSERAYSLTHVRYTPHESWTDTDRDVDPAAPLARARRQSRFVHMVHDAQRYLPCLADTAYRRSLFDVKTVLQKNEQDDGRPILVHREPPDAPVTSILGGKIDNIYDLFEHLLATDPRLARADGSCLFFRPGAVDA